MRARCRRSQPCRRATSPPKCCWKTCPPARTFSIASASAISSHTDIVERAGGRPLPHRARRPARCQFRLGRRRRRPGLGHQSRRWRHVHLRHHAQAPAGFPAAFRRHHLCRRHHCRRGEARRRQGLEERHDPEKAKVAETLDEFRAAHKYNFLDDNLRAFNAEVPIFVQWDDHEVTNNWSLSKQLPAAYKERDITLLAARAARALPRNVSDARKHRRAGPGLSHASITARISTCSCWTSAAIAAPTAPNLQAELWSRQLLSSDPTSSPG